MYPYKAPDTVTSEKVGRITIAFRSDTGRLRSCRSWSLIAAVLSCCIESEVSGCAPLLLSGFLDIRNSFNPI